MIEQTNQNSHFIGFQTTSQPKLSYCYLKYESQNFGNGFHATFHYGNSEQFNFFIDFVFQILLQGFLSNTDEFA